MKQLSMLISIWLLLSSCGREKVAGGGVVEVPNNVTARVLTSSGAPVSNARIVLWDADAWWLRQGISVHADTVKTDQKGYYNDIFLNRRRVLGFSGGEKAFWLSLTPALSAELRLDRPGFLRGQAPQIEGRYPTRVYLFGPPWEIVVDGNGFFVMDSLPKGIYPVIVRYPDAVSTAWWDAQAIEIRPGDTTRVELVLIQKRFVLEDFSDGDLYSRIQDFLGVGQWGLAENFASSSAETSWHRNVWNDSVMDLFPRERGWYLEVSFRSLGDRGIYNRLETAFSDSSCAGMSLAGIDSLILNARVQGRWRAGFTTRVSSGLSQWFAEFSGTGRDSVYRWLVENFVTQGPGVNVSRVCKFWLMPVDVEAAQSVLALYQVELTGIGLQDIMP